MDYGYSYFRHAPSIPPVTAKTTARTPPSIADNNKGRMANISLTIISENTKTMPKSNPVKNPVIIDLTGIFVKTQAMVYAENEEETILAR